MASGNAILAGILGGLGGAAGNIGSSIATAQKEDLEREKLAQERDLRQQVIDAQASQFATTQKGLSTPAEQLFGYIGMPLPAGMDPKQPIPNVLGDNLIKAAQEQQKVAREQQMQAGTAAFLRGAQGRPGQPAELMGQLAEGEDPEAAALIPRSANVPAVPPMSRMDVAAGLTQFGHKDAGLKTLMESIFSGSGGAFTPPPGSRPAPTVNEKGEVSTRYENEPWQYDTARRALADAGWQPGIKGYDNAFYDAVSALTPVTEGGGAATRSQGIPPPPGAPPRPAQTPTVITGPQKPVAGDTARSVAGAEQANAAVQRLVEGARNPEVQGYLGPYAQYWDEAQRRAPNALLGELPMSMVDLDQDIAMTKNYLYNLRSGAAVTPQEGERMEKELMKKSSRGPVFQREVENTARNIKQLEQRVKDLALRGDQNALGVAKQYGLLGDTQPSPAPQATPPPRSSSGGGGMIVTDGTKRFMWTGTKDELATQYPGFREWTP